MRQSLRPYPPHRDGHGLGPRTRTLVKLVTAAHVPSGVHVRHVFSAVHAWSIAS